MTPLWCMLGHIWIPRRRSTWRCWVYLCWQWSNTTPYKTGGSNGPEEEGTPDIQQGSVHTQRWMHSFYRYMALLDYFFEWLCRSRTIAIDPSRCCIVSFKAYTMGCVSFRGLTQTRLTSKPRASQRALPSSTPSTLTIGTIIQLNSSLNHWNSSNSLNRICSVRN